MFYKPGNFRKTIIRGLIAFSLIISNVWAQSSEQEIFKKAKIYYNKKKYKVAISEFTRVIQINLNNSGAYYWRGNAYHRTGKLDLAISDYLLALQIDPNNAGPYMGRGAVYLHKNKIEEALLDFNKAIELNPKFAEAYFDRALVYFIKKDYDLSWANVQQAELWGWKVKPQFLESLRKASGRNK
jgi:tetratricopeptide (TPR) repeat protein